LARNRQTQTVVTIPEEVHAELTLLRGFRDLVGEGIGYLLGARAIQAEVRDNEEIGKLRHAIPRIFVSGRPKKDSDRKTIIIEDLVKSRDTNAYITAMTEVEVARKALQDAMKPFNEKKAPLLKGWKYMVNVAVPDSLKELGAPVSPRFSLSDWVAQATAGRKKA